MHIDRIVAEEKITREKYIEELILKKQLELSKETQEEKWERDPLEKFLNNLIRQAKLIQDIL